MLGPKSVNDGCLWTISVQNIIQRVKLYVLTNFFIGIQYHRSGPRTNYDTPQYINF